MLKVPASGLYVERCLVIGLGTARVPSDSSSSRDWPRVAVQALHHDAGVRRSCLHLDGAQADQATSQPSGGGLGQRCIDGIDALLPVALEFARIADRFRGVGR